MPYSSRESDAFVIDFVWRNQIHSVLDVGAGAGKYFDILGPHVARIDGIEVWEPYVSEFNLHDKYDTLYVGDAREVMALDILDGSYDMVVFGDVLEHMPKEDALTLWQESARVATWGLISVPIIHFPQGAEYGNPYEVHVQDHLHPEDIRRDYGPFEREAIYEVTGAFIKRF